MRNGQGNVFNNPAVVAQSWYVVARSKNLQPGQVVRVNLGQRSIAVYRDFGGMARAVDALCPHVGADLSIGDVCSSGLRCAYHHWVFGDSGACVEAPGYATLPKRRVKQFPVEERWGLVWLFNGPEVGFELPSISGEGFLHTILLPSQRIRCHPHLVIGNGLDIHHFGALHGAELSDIEVVEKPTPMTMRIHFRARLQQRWRRALTGTEKSDVVASFASTGGSIAWMNIYEPFEFHGIFTGRPTPDGQCDTQSILCFNSLNPLYLFRAVALTAILLKDDRQVLDTLRFTGGFARDDVIMREYTEQVEQYPTW